ncbi:MAG TPA: hypothetical protein VJ802_01030 [Gemmatimonadaceae bacterium]|nr:hypothetical protein [Gemmatimonadaceae bacterium]
MHPPRGGVYVALAALLSVLASCGDGPTALRQPGAIEVNVLASGPDADMTDARVTVVNGAVHQLDSGRVLISDLRPGAYDLSLEGLRANCQVTSTNPRRVDVVSNRTTVIVFTVTCTRRVGTVRVTTTTTGTDLDPDGYTVMIEAAGHSVGVNGTVSIGEIGEGSRPVTLTGVAHNCTVAGGTTVTTAVNHGATSDVTFMVSCVAFGTLEVTVTTTGAGSDANGYTLSVQAASVGFSQDVALGVNGSVVLDRLRPAPDYIATIQGVSANCRITGAASHTLAVDPGATAHAAFAISCEAPRQLAFVRENDIYSMASDGSGLSRLTTAPAHDGEPAWSANGRIAFTTFRHANDAELYVMNEDGTNATRLTTSAGGDESPGWSPDGQKIVIQSYRALNWDIYTINPDGSGLTQLTANPADDMNPAWSRTGKIAFVSTRDHPAGEIYVMDADGSNVVRLTQNDSTEAAPAWSPDGSMLAFTREVECYYGCAHDIFVMNADGSSQRRLATAWQTYSFHTDPAWLPDGRTVSFTKQSCGYYYYCDLPAIWLVDTQGALLQRLISDGTGAVWKP